MILVTGGTGFVGRHLVEALLARGERVRVLSRRAPAGAAASGLEIATGDLADGASLALALRGADRVVHLAARVAADGDPRAMYEFNVRSSAAVAAAVREAGVAHLVHVSSGGVYGDGVVATPHREQDTPRPGNAYERSKLAAEAAVTDALDGSAVRLTILRPAGIFGAGRPATAAFLRQVRRSPVWLHSTPNVIVHPTHVSDVVQACLRALDAPAGRERVFNVAGERALPYQEFIALAASALGRRVPQLVVPQAIGRPLAQGCLAGLRAARLPVPATIERASRDCVNRSLDTTLARRTLGFSPIALDEALRETVGELRAHL